MTPSFPPRKLSWLLLGLGSVLLALAGKLALVERYGTDQPYADQWAAEGMYFLRGPLYYDITLEQLGSLHGEHRPGLTRVWVRALILANEGQWDCYLELVANLLIYALFLGTLWRGVGRRMHGRQQIFLAASFAVLFGLPAAYENFLWGFQSGFLALLALGAVHVTGTLHESRLGWRWWLAQVAGALALFSVAAGCLSAAALVALAILRLGRGRRDVWEWATLGVNLAIFTVGVALVPPHGAETAPWLDRLAQIAGSLGALLSWPLAGPWMCLFFYAPWLAVAVGAVRRAGNGEISDELRIGGLGLWVVGMATAIAYGRAVTSDTIGVRYYDVLVLGLFINIPALIRLWSASAGTQRLFVGGLGVAWLATVGFGLVQINRPSGLASMFEAQRRGAVEQRDVVRRFLVSDDPAEMQALTQQTGRFPHFDTTLALLRDPKVAGLLPPSLTPDGRQNRLSRFSRSVSRQWPVLMGFAAVCFVVGAVATWRRPAPANADGLK